MIYKGVPCLINIRDYINKNKIEKSISYCCPFCDGAVMHSDENIKLTGPKEDNNDGSYDWIEILECPIHNKNYYYLNGV